MPQDARWRCLLPSELFAGVKMPAFDCPIYRRYCGQGVVDYRGELCGICLWNLNRTKEVAK